MKTIQYKITVLFISILALTACESNDFEDETPSIANIAVSNSNFSTLESAAIQGGLAVTLSNSNPNDPSGSYTVFAPTNDAFTRLGLNSETLGVLQDGFLTNTLLYHTSNGDLLSSQINTSDVFPSLLGVNRRFVDRNGELFINGSKILLTDINASNGTVHAIDKVMIATGGDIVQSALALQNADVFINPELTFLVEAVLYAELAEALTASEGSPSFTVFAPTDQAFKDLGTALGLTFEEPADIRQLPKELVTSVLLNHVVPNGGKFTSELFQGAITPLGGENLTLGQYDNGILPVKGQGNQDAANMVIPDVQAVNGVIHVIDTVLLPNLE
jgi:uncharacterized surface protein with fasciclin (FAS1) repeats